MIQSRSRSLRYQRTFQTIQFDYNSRMFLKVKYANAKVHVQLVWSLVLGI